MFRKGYDNPIVGKYKKERGIIMDIREVYSYYYDDKFDMEDKDGRRLYINGEIDECVIDTIVYHLLRYNRQDKGLDISERKPIILYINSNGGSVQDGYGVIDAIVNSKTPVYTVNQASVFSMGFLIFLAGHKRFSMPSATFLMHDGSNFAWDSTAKMKDRMDFELDQVEKHTKNYIISRTSIDERTYDEKYRVEWYMYPKEAKKYNICNYIIGENCTIDEII